MATPYKIIAKEALMNWNGLSEEEATLKIKTETVNELEGQVYAMSSVKYAVVGLARQLGLSQQETETLFEAVVNGPEDSEIFSLVTEKAKGFSETQKLDILSDIHDGWVVDNSSQKTFEKKVSRQQLRQYVPLELIGWNEAKSDLLFLKPILASVGIEVDEANLSAAYYERVTSYMESMGISSKDDITDLVTQGSSFYHALPEELASRLIPLADTVSSQIIENWSNKDSRCLEIIKSREDAISK